MRAREREDDTTAMQPAAQMGARDTWVGHGPAPTAWVPDCADPLGDDRLPHPDAQPGSRRKIEQLSISDISTDRYTPPLGGIPLWWQGLFA